MKTVNFVFGVHNHQPIGNFDFVFEDAFQKSYLPFLKVLKNHPKIRIAIHFTGILIDWLEVHHPELLNLVREMTASGQLEVMSGAYYEPIISVIPEEDRIGQINKLTQRVKDLFGYQAKGMWLAERIWEPTLPSTLSDANIKYSVIDDTHFKYAGLTDKDLTGYFLSEDLGKSVALFPISKHLRYTIPFQHPDETINFLRKMVSEDGQNVIVFADDGEKFGVWPDTYHHVYENGWLDQFFTAVENNLDWIKMYHFSEILPKIKPNGKIYLPTASYAEMMHWSLFPTTFRAFEGFEHYLQQQGMYDEVGIFVRGGFWRNFMTKYSEVNIMHKKMLRVSHKLWNAKEKADGKIESAFDELWAGQCNCPYWHGVFGGLYLSHLRHAIFYSLINAEKILDQVMPPEYPVIDITDFDVDGTDEILVETGIHNAYFKPSTGATMFEYDFKPVSKNILDTMTRREEGYHQKLKEAKVAGQRNESNNSGTASIHDLVLAKEAGLEKYLNYDWYERKSLIDHFVDDSFNIESFSECRFNELGDFVNQPYQLLSKTSGQKSVSLQFKRDGFLWHNDERKALTVVKNINLGNDNAELIVEYELINHGNEPLEINFAVEMNFGLQAGHADDRYYFDEKGKLEDPFLDSKGIIENSGFIGLKDVYMRLDIRLSSGENARILRVPVETISLSEAGFERVYQSSAVVFKWNVHLTDRWKTSLKQVVKKM